MNTLIIITGPTGSGKTDLAIQLAERLGCDVISADSRQIYRGIPIGTAAPTAEQLSRVPHHFVGTLDLHESYSAAQYESDVLQLLPQLWAKNDVQVMCGGSMMYIDAVCHGIDNLPDISDEVRQQVKHLYETNGLAEVCHQLQQLDPVSYDRIDLMNPRRVIHALEISIQAGVPCSTLMTGKKKDRDFVIKKYSLTMPREQLFARINARVDKMMAAGLLEEARSVYHLRDLNSLNTVGYKEMFAYLDGIMDYDTAVARLAKNTRVYAKKQMTWLKRDPSVINIQSLQDI